MASTLTTYDATTFKQRFLERSAPIEQYFKYDYELLFCIPIEKLAPHTKVPVPACKEQSYWCYKLERC
jgi:hypothetical protein